MQSQFFSHDVITLCKNKIYNIVKTKKTVEKIDFKSRYYIILLQNYIVIKLVPHLKKKKVLCLANIKIVYKCESKEFSSFFLFTYFSFDDEKFRDDFFFFIFFFLFYTCQKQRQMNNYSFQIHFTILSMKRYTFYFCIRFEKNQYNFFFF